MQRQRPVSFWGATPTPAGAVLLLSVGLLFCCGKDEATDPHPTTPIDGNVGGEGGTGGAGAGGSSSHPLAGAGSATEAGGGNDAGGTTTGGSAQAGGPATTAGAGGDDQGPVSEQLSFGSRIPEQFVNAGDVARLYNHAVYDDCRIRWVTDLFLAQGQQVDFINDLVQWNLNFWGCQGGPVDNFALIYGEAPLSAGDAALLIEHYVAVATSELGMSQPEIDEMQAALERLSRPLINDESGEPSQPLCENNNAGAGGAGEVALGGAGGAAPPDTAGQGGLQ